ncbi:hypothetical protein PM082_023437 [Marasmius tenuissimus]|nr:hypothetical protein PM082_023437 [Marasmius tenuissimus]
MVHNTQNADIIEFSDTESIETSSLSNQSMQNNRNANLSYDRLQVENELLKSQLADKQQYERQLQRERQKTRNAEAAQFSSGRRLKAMRQREHTAVSCSRHPTKGDKLMVTS